MMSIIEAVKLAREIHDRLTEIRDELRELRAQTGGWESYAGMIRELRELREAKT